MEEGGRGGTPASAEEGLCMGTSGCAWGPAPPSEQRVCPAPPCPQSQVPGAPGRWVVPPTQEWSREMGLRSGSNGVVLGGCAGGCCQRGAGQKPNPFPVDVVLEQDV